MARSKQVVRRVAPKPVAPVVHYLTVSECDLMERDVEDAYRRAHRAQDAAVQAIEQQIDVLINRRDVLKGVK